MAEKKGPFSRTGAPRQKGGVGDRAIDAKEKELQKKIEGISGEKLDALVARFSSLPRWFQRALILAHPEIYENAQKAGPPAGTVVRSPQEQQKIDAAAKRVEEGTATEEDKALAAIVSPEERAEKDRARARDKVIHGNLEDVYIDYDFRFFPYARRIHTGGRLVEDLDGKRTFPGGGSLLAVERTFGEYLNEIIGNTQHIRDLQARLVAAGYLGEDSLISGTQKYVPGDLDDATQTAMMSAAKDASFRKQTLDERLEERAKLISAEPVEDELEKSFQDQYRQSLFRAYFETWGTAPAAAYIEDAAKAGVNVYEFTYNERQKPAFVDSPRFAADKLSTKARIAREWGIF